MKTPRLLTLGATILVVTVACADKADESAMSQTVALHHQWREEAGNDPLTWDQDLADGAQRWAEHLAGRKVMEHDSAPWYESWTAGGENIASGSTPEKAAMGWYREKEFFEEIQERGVDCDPGVISASDYMKCGHYANIVGDFTHIGCGLSGQFLVCRYGKR